MKAFVVEHVADGCTQRNGLRSVWLRYGYVIMKEGARFRFGSRHVRPQDCSKINEWYLGAFLAWKAAGFETIE